MKIIIIHLEIGDTTMKQKLEFIVPSSMKGCGTSFHHGIVKNSAAEIEKVLGKYSKGCDYKTKFEWLRQYGSIVFYVYDYRISPLKNQVAEYHIGTSSREDTLMIVEALKSAGLNAYIEK